MFKKILPYSVITLILIIIVSVIIGVFMRKIRDNKEIPLFTDMYFGMTPLQVNKQLGQYYDACLDDGISDKTSYSYQVKVLGYDAIVTCYFLNNKQLTDFTIKWNGNDDNISKQAYNCLYDFYSTNKDFFSEEKQYYNDKHATISIGIDNKITGIFYYIYHTDEYIMISGIEHS